MMSSSASEKLMDMDPRLDAEASMTGLPAGRGPCALCHGVRIVAGRLATACNGRVAGCWATKCWPMLPSVEVNDISADDGRLSP